MSATSESWVTPCQLKHKDIIYPWQEQNMSSTIIWTQIKENEPGWDVLVM